LPFWCNLDCAKCRIADCHAAAAAAAAMVAAAASSISVDDRMWFLRWPDMECGRHTAVIALYLPSSLRMHGSEKNPAIDRRTAIPSCLQTSVHLPVRQSVIMGAEPARNGLSRVLSNGLPWRWCTPRSLAVSSPPLPSPHVPPAAHVYRISAQWRWMTLFISSLCSRKQNWIIGDHFGWRYLNQRTWYCVPSTDYCRHLAEHLLRASSFACICFPGY